MPPSKDALERRRVAALVIIAPLNMSLIWRVHICTVLLSKHNTSTGNAWLLALDYLWVHLLCYLLAYLRCIPARAIMPLVTYVFLHAWCLCGAGYQPESNMEHASKTRTARSLLEKDVGKVRLAHLCCKHVGVVSVCSLTLFDFPPMLALCLFNHLPLLANS